MMHFFRTLLDALIPPHADSAIAASMTESVLLQLLAPRTVRGAYALFPYHDARVRAVVRAIKFYGETGVLTPLGIVAAEQLDGVLEDEGLEQGTVIVAPIPSSGARLRKRGYNQAERIARTVYQHLANRDQIIYHPSLLAREERETQIRAQRGRKDNIKGAFFVPDPANVRGKRIILIDDVIKTGATFADATRALKGAGAKSVTCFAIAY